MNKNQQAAIDMVYHLFPIAKPKGYLDAEGVRNIYDQVMSYECTCKIVERTAQVTVTDKCRRCTCEHRMKNAWPFLAEPT